MYLAFIHIGRYDIKARRHLACVQNGITQLGDWRMETWQLPLRACCHVSIRQSPSLCNAILNTCPCLLAIISYGMTLVRWILLITWAIKTYFIWHDIGMVDPTHNMGYQDHIRVPTASCESKLRTFQGPFQDQKYIWRTFMENFTMQIYWKYIT